MFFHVETCVYIMVGLLDAVHTPVQSVVMDAVHCW